MRKTLEARLPVVVVVNKVDRSDARIEEVVHEIEELFLDLDADEDQVGFPVPVSYTHLDVYKRQALYEARELAMTRMQDEGNALGATGIVGVRLEEKSHQWGSHTIEFLSIGTAVTKTTGDVTLPRPTVIISLDN